MTMISVPDLMVQVHRVAVPAVDVIAARGAVVAVGLDPPGAQELAQRLNLRLRAGKDPVLSLMLLRTCRTLFVARRLECQVAT
jgi:hypothetical protein